MEIFFLISCYPWILGWPKIWPWPWMTLLIKPIDLPGVRIFQKKIRENFKILWGWLGPRKGQLVWWAAPSDGFVKFWDALLDTYSGQKRIFMLGKLHHRELTSYLHFFSFFWTLQIWSNLLYWKKKGLLILNFGYDLSICIDQLYVNDLYSLICWICWILLTRVCFCLIE